jgi:hypothetical protein
VSADSEPRLDLKTPLHLSEVNVDDLVPKRHD